MVAMLLRPPVPIIFSIWPLIWVWGHTMYNIAFILACDISTILWDGFLCVLGHTVFLEGLYPVLVLHTKRGRIISPWNKADSSECTCSIFHPVSKHFYCVLYVLTKPRPHNHLVCALSGLLLFQASTRAKDVFMASWRSVWWVVAVNSTIFSLVPSSQV